MANTVLDITKLIKTAIDVEINKEAKVIVEKAIEKAQKDIGDSVKDVLAKVAMKVLSHYDVFTMDNKVVITVRNDLS